LHIIRSPRVNTNTYSGAFREGQV